MGTALGDLSAYSVHLGYFVSAAVFAGVVALPAIGFSCLRWDGVVSFWFAYVVTRPLGASLADALGKPRTAGGLGLGAGAVALGLAALVACLVGYLSLTKGDVQAGSAA